MQNFSNAHLWSSCLHILDNANDKRKIVLQFSYKEERPSCYHVKLKFIFCRSVCILSLVQLTYASEQEVELWMPA